MKIFSAKKFVGIFFLIFGLIWLAGSLLAMFATDFGSYDEVSAVITDIIDGGYSDDSPDVYVEYEYNGVRYSGRSNYYSSSMRIGDEMRIYVAPDNPNEFFAKGTETIAVVFAVLGLAFFLAGAILLLSTIQKRRKEEALKSSGERIDADITGIERVSHVRINGRNPYRILCKVTTPSGAVYEYKTGYIRQDPSGTLSGLRTLPVYVDTYERDKYYIALEEI